MRYLILFLLPLSLFCQDIKIYDHNRYGIKYLTPSQSLEKTEKGFNIYNYNKYGIKDLRPSYRAIEADNKIKIYKYNEYGSLEVTPTQTIDYSKIMFDKLKNKDGKHNGPIQRRRVRSNEQ